MTASSRALRITCAVLSVTCAVSLAACGASHNKKAESSSLHTPGPTSKSAAPKAKPKPKPKPNNPYTGGRPSSHGVVAVKIDDTGHGRPQRNIDKADIVYIEQVEGGLTRLLAIYNSTLPTVEAVRSTRASDPELVEQYGRIAYAASGGAPNPLRVLARSDLKTSVNDAGGPGFERDGSRAAPYNLMANLAVVAKSLRAPRAKPIGLNFSAVPKLTGKPRAPTVQTVVGATPVRFDWNRQLRRYVRVIGGATQHTASGRAIVTSNVIVQFCRVTVYPQDTDVNGNPSQFTHTVGSGRVVVFRNGHRIDGTWKRTKARSGTAYTRFGKPLHLAPGRSWIVLVARNAPLTS